MRLVISGGRYFNDVALLWRTLDELHESVPGGIQLLVEGASDDVTGPYVGADYWGHEWALARQVPALRQRAEWKKHGKAAGPIRNGEMLTRYLPDRLVAFPGGRGTADMISKAERAGVTVQRVAGPTPPAERTGT
jgi:hypothetical protein